MFGRTSSRQWYTWLPLLFASATAQRLSLHKAAAEGQIEPLKVAIRGRFDPYEDEWKKPDVNGQNKKGQVALHLAVCNRRGDMAAVRVLLEDGRADPNAQDKATDTPLHVVARMCNDEERFGQHALSVAGLLIKHGAEPATPATEAKITPLHVAAEAGHVRLVDLLLRHGGSTLADTPDATGRTPLHYATQSLRAKVVFTLLQHGANPRAADSAGKVPFDEVAGGKDSFAVTIRQHLERSRQIYTEAVAERERKVKAKADAKEKKQGKAKTEL